MAKGSTAPARSETVEVTDQAQSRALAAAWDGVYHFFGGRVENWELIPPTDENPDGELIAHGFSVNGNLDPNQILSDIGKRNRRLEMLPNYFYLFDNVTPPEFTEAQDMTNFMVQYLKGSVEAGTAKTPEYVRNAVAEYKAQRGLTTRRGPRRKIIRLDELASIDASQLRAIPQDQLEAFLRLAQGIADAATANGSPSTEEAATTS